MHSLIDGLGTAALDPGNTGPHAGYLGGEIYELQFAKGRMVGDVVCSAPYGKPSPACESVARRVAEGWYASLP